MQIADIKTNKLIITVQHQKTHAVNLLHQLLTQLRREKINREPEVKIDVYFTKTISCVCSRVCLYTDVLCLIYCLEESLVHFIFAEIRLTFPHLL